MKKKDKHEVTVEEYYTFCKATGKDLPKDKNLSRNKPIVNVDWYDAIDYCNWLSKEVGLKCVYEVNRTTKDSNNHNIYDQKKWLITIDTNANGYRLPFEAEWEYAAREGGKKIRFGNGKNIAENEEINANGIFASALVQVLNEKPGGKTVPIDSLLGSQNELGLYHMSGNVYEWCWDWYADYQRKNKQLFEGAYRICRGGSWRSEISNARASFRYPVVASSKSNYVGFRLAKWE